MLLEHLACVQFPGNHLPYPRQNDVHQSTRLTGEVGVGQPSGSPTATKTMALAKLDPPTAYAANSSTAFFGWLAGKVIRTVHGLERGIRHMHDVARCHSPNDLRKSRLPQQSERHWDAPSLPGILPSERWISTSPCNPSRAFAIPHPWSHSISYIPFWAITGLSPSLCASIGLDQESGCILATAERVELRYKERA